MGLLLLDIGGSAMAARALRSRLLHSLMPWMLRLLMGI
ncbi:hypothetical protein F443_16984 [Phytophthora nicotianae P1569]|uniref:Uncharacterized protein n=1 Tax=Phytophthora nicotianae P1569 TaxID=1317065 RepID=V9EDL0_PHYNI|nr:hypothetical protein F443_16984 [Phytophthora nicotianae P1569]